jgi:hypothetical protein
MSNLLPLTSRLLVFLSPILLLHIQSAAQSNKSTFYVSTIGSDSWSGRLTTPNSSRTDGPFATLGHARDVVRNLRRTGRLPKDGIAILVRGGTYHLSRSFRLNHEDSGTKDQPVAWQSYRNEKVVLSGSKSIGGFQRVTDAALLQRISPTYHANVRMADLKRQGISDYGEISQRGSPALELFFKGKRMTLARWPNTGWLRIADVPQSGDSLFNKGLEREKRFDGVPVGRHYGRIKYEGDRPRRWSQENEIMVHGYWTWDWSDSYQKVKSIDPEAHEVTLQEPHHHYGYTKNQRFYFLNIFEELDAPGEWYLDRKNGLLYFWPPEPITESSVTISMLSEPLVTVDSASNLTISGITFEQSRSSGAVLRGCTDVLIAGCTFRNLGGEAVVIDGGTRNGIRSCDLFDLSLGGIRLNGGDRNTLVPANNFAENNHIHHYSSWIRTGQYALFLDGVGQRVRNNRIHDAPHEGLSLRGNDHLIEYNEVYRLCQETGDAGALHTGRDFTWRGNVIRYNYFHDLLGPGLHGVMGVYLDDWASGFTVYGNLFYRAGRAMMIGGGRDNLVENNIFVECCPSVHVDARGLGWAGYFFDGSLTLLFDQLKEMKYKEPPYSTRYPELLSLDQGNPALPVNNRIVRNVSYGGRWLDIYDYNAFDASIYTIKDNLIADTALCRRLPKNYAGWDPYYLDIDRKDGYVLLMSSDREAREELRGNTFVTGDPGFVDLKRRDFRFKTSSRASTLGFRPIPFGSIGLVKDKFRLRLPDR